jgi:hypothetical protein
MPLALSAAESVGMVEPPPGHVSRIPAVGENPVVVSNSPATLPCIGPVSSRRKFTTLIA